MAVGDVKSGTNNALRTLKLLEGLAAVNSPPATATAGIACYCDMNKAPNDGDNGLSFRADAAAEATILIKGVGTDVVTGTFRLWGYSKVAATWFPLGTGTDAGKGVLNAGAALGEVTANVVLHAEPILYPGHFDRLYLECTAIGGTDPSFDAWIVTPRTISY